MNSVLRRDSHRWLGQKLAEFDAALQYRIGPAMPRLQRHRGIAALKPRPANRACCAALPQPPTFAAGTSANIPRLATNYLRGDTSPQTSFIAVFGGETNSRPVG
jgi:hypothetical protein